MRRRAIHLALVGLLMAPVAAQAGDADLTVTRRAQLSPRLIELGFTTKALPAETNVRILLPAGYDTEPRRRWPVLYLLHGCCDADVDGSQAWTIHGAVEKATADLPLIVVMPAGGRGGMYSDWISAGAQGLPQWQTYHLDQLLPWVDANLRTIATREGRAIAGLSMGGFGAMKYAAEHPDRFLAAASFSGIVDSNVNAGAIHQLLPGLDGGTPATVWGPRATDELRWRSQNPWDLAENLRPLQLTIRTGNGQPGPLDDGGAPYDVVEGQAEQNSVSLHERLATLGIAHVWDHYGDGTHTWPYWTRGLRQTLAVIMPLFATPPAGPARVTYRSARPAYEVFDWRVAFRRDALAWSRLSDASRDGFVLEGDGTADVRTPRSVPPGAEIAVDGAPVAVAVDAGRVTVPVVLGDDGRAVVRITAPVARRRCTSRRVITVTLPSRLRRSRATLDGRAIPVRDRRVRVDLRGKKAGTYTLVVRGRDSRGRSVRLLRRFRTCA